MFGTLDNPPSADALSLVDSVLRRVAVLSSPGRTASAIFTALPKRPWALRLIGAACLVIRTADASEGARWQ